MSENGNREKKDVFISYKSEDRAQALWVKNTLEINGISCWIAPECIPGGSNYAVEIPEAINNCSVLVVVLTEKSKASVWVPKEIGDALNKNKIVMPFVLEDFILSSEYNFYLNNVQRYEAYKNKSEAIERMVNEIKTILGLKNSDYIAFDETAKAEAPKAEKTEKDNGGKQKKPSSNRKHRFRIIIAAVTALLIIASVFAGIFHNKGKSASEDYSPSINSESYSVDILPVNDDILRETSTKSEIKFRLDNLCSEDNYIIEEYDKKLNLTIPKSVFLDKNPNYIINTYIITNTELEFRYSDKSQNVQSEDLSKDYIKSVKLLKGKVDGFDSSDYETPDEYYYISVELSKSFFNKISTDNITSASIVYKYDPDVSFDVYKSDEKDRIYIVDSFAQGKFTHCLEYLLMTETTLDIAVESNIDSKQYAMWELSDESNFNQCNYNDIGTDSVIFRYELEHSISSEEQKAIETALKARLDALCDKYAFGRLMYNKTFSGYCIRTDTSFFNRTVVNMLLGNEKFFLQAGLKQMKLDLSNIDKENSVVTSKGLRLQLPEKTIKAVNAFIESVDSSDDFLYLGYSDYPVVCGRTKRSIKKNYLEFQYYAYNDMVEWEQIYLDTRYARMLLETIENPVDMSALYFDDTYYDLMTDSTDASHKYHIAFPNKFHDSHTYEIESAVKDRVDSSIEIQAGTGEEFRIGNIDSFILAELPENYDIDNNLISLLQTVYEASDFEHLPYKIMDIVFYYKDDRAFGEICYRFTKSYGTFDYEKNKNNQGYIYITKSYTKDMKQYSNKLNKSIESNNYFRNYKII